MLETRTVTLGGRPFEVPQLPLGVTMVVYPICQRLTLGGLVQRLGASESLQLTEGEAGDLTELAFQAAHSADETIDAKAFLALPVTPPELFEAFFVMRIQCGGWRTASAAGEPDEGETRGGEEPPKSTSAAS